MAEAPRVVAFGGGIGLPLLLSGLRQTSGDGVCGVVTVADDGGSSGPRQELGSHRPGTSAGAWSRSRSGVGSPRSSSTDRQRAAGRE